MQEINDNNLYISEDLFFLLENGKVLVWNYKLHEQFILETEYFSELISIAKTNKPQNTAIADQLLEAKLITKKAHTSPTWGWDALSKIFHMGTQNVANKNIAENSEEFAKKYIESCKSLAHNSTSICNKKSDHKISLPKPDLSRLENPSYFSILKQRKTCREFSAKTIKLETLSNLLYYSFGLIHGNWDELESLDLEITGVRKATPASGGIHSEEAYVVVYGVDDIPSGLYHYNFEDHSLNQLKLGNFEKLNIKMNYDQYYSEGLAVGIYLTSQLNKIWWKYKHSRAYRSVLLDLGHVSQNFLMTATALNLQTWMTGAFHDKEVEEFLEIDQSDESVFLFIGAGIGTNKSIPQSIKNQLGNN